MSYYLLFALKLEQQNSQVFYSSEAFADHAIIIDVPEVKELISYFISTLRTVAIVEKKTPERDKGVTSVENDQGDKLRLSQLPLEKEPDEHIVILREVAAEAYICQVKDLDRSDSSAFSQLRSGLADYLSENASKLTSENILSTDLNTVFAGIRQAIDLRNYLLNFVENPNKKKMYQEGFIYIMDI